MTDMQADVFAATQIDGYDLLVSDLEIAGVQEWYLHDAGSPLRIIVRLEDGRRFTLTAEEQS